MRRTRADAGETAARSQATAWAGELTFRVSKISTVQLVIALKRTRLCEADLN